MGQRRYIRAATETKRTRMVDFPLEPGPGEGRERTMSVENTREKGAEAYRAAASVGKQVG